MLTSRLELPQLCGPSELQPSVASSAAFADFSLFTAWPVPDVYEALIKAFTGAGKTVEEAQAHIEELKEEERYILEVYVRVRFFPLMVPFAHFVMHTQLLRGQGTRSTVTAYLRRKLEAVPLTNPVQAVSSEMHIFRRPVERVREQEQRGRQVRWTRCVRGGCCA